MIWNALEPVSDFLPRVIGAYPVPDTIQIFRYLIGNFNGNVRKLIYFVKSFFLKNSADWHFVLFLPILSRIESI